MKKITFYGMLIITLLAAQISVAAIIPAYQVTGDDYTWTHAYSPDSPDSLGVYTVPTIAEDYDNEIWERPIKDNEWTDSGDIRTSNKMYYGYADLKHGAWGVGTNEGEDYLFVKWEVVGAFSHTVTESAKPNLLEGHYYFYAEPFGKTGFAVEVNSPKDLRANFGDVSGKVYIYKEEAEGDVPGTGITTTGEGGNSFGTGLPRGEGRINTSTFVTEVAVLLDDLGLEISDFTDNPLDYAYIGVAVSNPSDPNTGLFANDHYKMAAGVGVEYDTLKMGNAVPIPGAIWLLGSGLIGLAGIRRKFGKE